MLGAAPKNVPAKDTDALEPVVNLPCAQPEAGGVNTYVPTGEDTLYMVFFVSAVPLSGRAVAVVGDTVKIDCKRFQLLPCPINATIPALPSAVKMIKLELSVTETNCSIEFPFDNRTPKTIRFAL